MHHVFWATVTVWFQYLNIKLLRLAKAILHCKNNCTILCALSVVTGIWIFACTFLLKWVREGEPKQCAALMTLLLRGSHSMRGCSEFWKSFVMGKHTENAVVCCCALNWTGCIERFGKIPNIVASLICNEGRVDWPQEGQSRNGGLAYMHTDSKT